MGKGAVQDEGPPGDREMTNAIFGKKQLAKLYYLKLLRLENHSAKTQSQYFPNIHSLPPSSIFQRSAKGPCQTHKHVQKRHWTPWFAGPAVSTLSHQGVSMKADLTRVILLAIAKEHSPSFPWVSLSIAKPFWEWVVMSGTRVAGICCSAKLRQVTSKTIIRDRNTGRLSKARCKHGDRPPIPEPMLKRRRVVYTCNLRTGKADTGWSLELAGQEPSLLGKF